MIVLLSKGYCNSTSRRWHAPAVTKSLSEPSSAPQSRTIVRLTRVKSVWSELDWLDGGYLIEKGAITLALASAVALLPYLVVASVSLAEPDARPGANAIIIENNTTGKTIWQLRTDGWLASPVSLHTFPIASIMLPTNNVASGRHDGDCRLWSG